MTGVTPTPPAASAAATAGLAASAMRRAPDEAAGPETPEADTPRRGPLRPPAAAAQPDPEGHRGRLVNVFA